jgi:hypothetical protein
MWINEGWLFTWFVAHYQGSIAISPERFQFSDRFALIILRTSRRPLFIPALTIGCTPCMCSTPMLCYVPSDGVNAAFCSSVVQFLSICGKKHCMIQTFFKREKVTAACLLAFLLFYYFHTPHAAKCQLSTVEHFHLSTEKRGAANDQWPTVRRGQRIAGTRTRHPNSWWSLSLYHRAPNGPCDADPAAVVKACTMYVLHSCCFFLLVFPEFSCWLAKLDLFFIRMILKCSTHRNRNMNWVWMQVKKTQRKTSCKGKKKWCQA